MNKMKTAFAVLITSAVSMGIARSEETYTPKPGSEERRKIMDVMRRSFYNDRISAAKNKDGLLFIVHHLKVKDGWACVLVTPTKSEKIFGEPMWELLRKIDTRWVDVDYFDQARPYKDEIEAQNALDMEDWVVRRLLDAFPSCPPEIFPWGSVDTRTYLHLQDDSPHLRTQ